jgi:hypothetical protein
MIPPNRFAALSALAPNSKFVTDGTGTILNSKLLKGDSLPTDEEIDAKLASMLSDWNKKDYARNRKRDYPAIDVQLNKIYDDGLTKWKSEMIDPVKAKWPKDNSGPIE